MGIYSIDSKFDFGKYEGFTIREVHQGTLLIERKLLKQYLIHLLSEKESCLYVNINDYKVSFFDLYSEANVTEEGINFLKEEIIDIVDGEVVTELKKVILSGADRFLDDYVNMCNTISGIIGGLTSLQKFTHKTDIKNLLFNDSDYISWCIREVDEFILEPKALENLGDLRAISLGKFNFLQTSSGVCQYSICTNVSQYIYSESIKELNEKKFDSFFKKYI